MNGTYQVHIGPDDTLDPHYNGNGTFILGVDGPGGQYLSLFIADEDTHRRLAQAVLSGLLQGRGQVTDTEAQQAVELCVECGEGEPFVLLGDRRVCARCARLDDKTIDQLGGVS